MTSAAPACGVVTGKEGTRSSSIALSVSTDQHVAGGAVLIGLGDLAGEVEIARLGGGARQRLNHAHADDLLVEGALVGGKGALMVAVEFGHQAKGIVLDAADIGVVEIVHLLDHRQRRLGLARADLRPRRSGTCR